MRGEADKDANDIKIKAKNKTILRGQIVYENLDLTQIGQ